MKGNSFNIFFKNGIKATYISSTLAITIEVSLHQVSNQGHYPLKASIALDQGSKIA